MPDAVELTIESLGAGGDGVAHHEGRLVHVPLTAPGDRVRVSLESRPARFLELLAPGARRLPPCRHFGKCGGCALQHVAEAAYTAAKEEQVRQALAHHGITGVMIAPLQRLPPGTRRRARFAVSSRGVGFRRRTSHQLVNLEECYVLDPRLFACVAPLRRNAPLFWPRGGQGAATVQWAEAGADLLLDMAAPPDLATLEHLARFAEAQDLARLSWRAPGSGLATPVAERRPVQVIFAGVAVDLPPDSFLQASVEAEAALTSAVLEAVGSASRIADLYAGLGTFTFALAARAHLHAVEVSKPAIASLSRAASRAGLAHRITTERRDLTLSPLSPQELGRFDAVLFDPPRAGAREQALCIARAQIPLVVAISCDPATFARDARTLLDGGYRLTRVLPIDQFPWSPHVELIAVFAGP